MYIILVNDSSSFKIKKILMGFRESTYFEFNDDLVMGFYDYLIKSRLHKKQMKTLYKS